MSSACKCAKELENNSASLTVRCCPFFSIQGSFCRQRRRLVGEPLTRMSRQICPVVSEPATERIVTILAMHWRKSSGE